MRFVSDVKIFVVYIIIEEFFQVYVSIEKYHITSFTLESKRVIC